MIAPCRHWVNQLPCSSVWDHTKTEFRDIVDLDYEITYEMLSWIILWFKREQDNEWNLSKKIVIVETDTKRRDNNKKKVRKLQFDCPIEWIEKNKTWRI